MGFIDWFKSTPEDSEETQLDLLNSSSQPIRGRVDGAVIRKDFTRAIQESGGDDQAHANSTAGMTRELFDCEVKDLYRETGGKRGDRTTLPAEAQKAYMVGETVATHDLKQAGKFDGNQQQVNRQIEDTVVDSSRKARKLFPW